MFTYIRDVLVMSNAIMQFIKKVWLLIDKEEEAKLCKKVMSKLQLFITFSVLFQNLNFIKNDGRLSNYRKCQLYLQMGAGNRYCSFPTPVD